MSKRLWLVGVVAVAVLLAAVLREPVRAEKKEAKTKEDVNTKIVQYLMMAGELEKFARGEDGKKIVRPEALITAADLLLQVDALTGGKLPELDAKVEDEKGNPVAAPAGNKKSFKEQADNLLDEAEGTGVPGLNTLIKAAKNHKYEGFAGRDVVGGPKSITRAMGLGGLHTFTFKFRPKQQASINVQSNNVIRFEVVQPGLGQLFNLVCTNGYYNWVPKGNQDVEIQVKVQTLNKQAQYTLYVK